MTKKEWAEKVVEQTSQQKQILLWALEMWTYVRLQVDRDIPEIREVMSNLEVVNAQLAYLENYLASEDLRIGKLRSVERGTGSSTDPAAGSNSRGRDRGWAVGRKDVPDHSPSPGGDVDTGGQERRDIAG